MKLRYWFAIGIVLSLAIFVIAQGGGLGGRGGSLGGINVNPAVLNHHWKNCLIAGNLTINYEILEINTTEEWFRYKGVMNFRNSTYNCNASIGKYLVEWDSQRGLTARSALEIDLRKRWTQEYNRNYTRVPSIKLGGNYTR